MSYDVKYKKRAIEYKKERHTLEETAKVFKIGTTTLKSWIKIYETTGNLEIRKGFIEPYQYNRTMYYELFETWLTQKLLPKLPQNSHIIMDNATFHRKSTLPVLAEKVIFLPPYSPELNPTRHFWANLKNNLERFSLISPISMTLYLSVLRFFEYTFSLRFSKSYLPVFISKAPPKVKFVPIQVNRPLFISEEVT
ncbi:MAG: transposase [Spirochaetaceae bacterium]|nr:transposase [Spirochaetaceae bacterium]